MICQLAQDAGPPETVVEAGTFLHPCEGEAVCKLTNEKVRCLPVAAPHRWSVGHAGLDLVF